MTRALIVLSAAVSAGLAGCGSPGASRRTAPDAGTAAGAGGGTGTASGSSGSTASSGTTGSSSTGSTSTGATGTSGLGVDGGAMPAGCVPLQYSAYQVSGGYNPSTDITSYGSAGNGGANVLGLWMVWSSGGQPTPAAMGQPVDLSTQNPDTCFACASFGSLCTNGQSCNATFYAASGQMTLVNDDRTDGGWVEFQLSNVAFRVWDRTNHTFPPGSDCYDLSSGTFVR